jgi:hypothetical protein
MNKTDQFIIISILICLFIMLYVYTHTERKVVYPCDLAEISPDIPLQVKQECRKLKRGN